MSRLLVLAAIFGVCLACDSPEFSSLEPDNIDSLDEIPPPPPPTSRDDAEDSPYDPPEDERDNEEPEDEPPEEPEDEDPVTPAPVTPPPVTPPAPTPWTWPTPPPVTPPAPTPPAPTPTPTTPPVTPGGCPSGVTCVASLPAVETGTTTGGTVQYDGYSCSPGVDESGPERVYQVDLPSDGFLAATLSGVTGDVDVDVHLLTDLAANSCIDRGHWDAAGLLPAGRYYVVVDSWVDGSGVSHDGSYTVRFQHTAYDHLLADGLSTLAMQRSLTAFDTAWRAEETSSLTYTIADFTMPSNQRRLWTFSLATGEVLFNLHVAHGSGGANASSGSSTAVMSNTNGSHQSSVGLMRAAETYTGSKGYSMRLDGLETGFNERVRPRAIVVHQATYAAASFAASNGYLGRSWGCPAVDPAVSRDLIDTIKNGSLYMSYFDDSSWLNQSTYL